MRDKEIEERERERGNKTILLARKQQVSKQNGNSTAAGRKRNSERVTDRARRCARIVDLELGSNPTLRNSQSFVLAKSSQSNQSLTTCSIDILKEDQ